jgi:hypothetical protein
VIFRYLLFVAVIVLSSGCGKQERIEAVQLSQALKNSEGNLATANSVENDFVTSAREWSADITANGAGRGVQLDQNGIVATELAKSAVAISAQLGKVRQAVYDLSLKQEYLQSVRDSLITQLSNRQRALQGMRTLLEQSVPAFVEYRHSKTYLGDTYPGGIGELNALLQAYKPPADDVGSALTTLKAKYKLSDKEL